MAKVAHATSLVKDALAVRLDFRVVAEIPTNASGKPDRQALLHHLAKGI
jgi:predicted alpha/beta-hydrolase family hydrolase